MASCAKNDNRTEVIIKNARVVFDFFLHSLPIKYVLLICHHWLALGDDRKPPGVLDYKHVVSSFSPSHNYCDEQLIH